MGVARAGVPDAATATGGIEGAATEDTLCAFGAGVDRFGER